MQRTGRRQVAGWATGWRIRTCRCDDGSERCSGFGAREVGKNVPPSTPPSATTSTSTAASPPEPTPSRTAPPLAPSAWRCLSAAIAWPVRGRSCRKSTAAMVITVQVTRRSTSRAIGSRLPPAGRFTWCRSLRPRRTAVLRGVAIAVKLCCAQGRRSKRVAVQAEPRSGRRHASQCSAVWTVGWARGIQRKITGDASCANTWSIPSAYR